MIELLTEIIIITSVSLLICSIFYGFTWFRKNSSELQESLSLEILHEDGLADWNFKTISDYDGS